MSHQQKKKKLKVENEQGLMSCGKPDPFFNDLLGVQNMNMYVLILINSIK